MKSLAFLLPWCLAAAALANEPLLEKVDVFEGGKEGYALYRIPAVAVTPKGTILAFCEARRTGKSDWDEIDILMRRSTDGGKTWGERQKLSGIPGEHQKNPVIAGSKYADAGLTYNNPVPIAGRDGSIHLLLCLEYMRCFYLQSTDDGLSWSKPIEITAVFEKFRPEYDWKVIATGPGHAIELRTGRLVVPVWLSTGTGSGAHRPSVTATIYSDDRGQTWERGDIAIPSTEEWINPNETAAVELVDGSVMLNARSESKPNRRLVTVSKDGAKTWSTPRFDETLPEPICMASLLRLSPQGAGDKSRILFANPDNLERADGKLEPGKGRDRKNLSIKLSYDEAQTWSVGKALEPGSSGYSDLAALPGGAILCLYERASTDGKATGRLTLARFNLEWLTDEKDAMR